MSASWAVVDFDQWPYAPVAAHRGGGRLAPENTLAAMRMAAHLGHRMVEFDVRLAADGRPFLMHDATLRRTTGLVRAARGLTYADIAKLDAGRGRGAGRVGEPPPSLDVAAAFLQSVDMAANVEIKAALPDESLAGATIALACADLWAGAASPPLLSAFSERVLSAALSVAPRLPRALLCAHPLRADWLEVAMRIGAVSLNVDYRSLSPARVEKAHAARLRIIAYTVNSPPAAARLRAWGVDGVITDAIDCIHP